MFLFFIVERCLGTALGIVAVYLHAMSMRICHGIPQDSPNPPGVSPWFPHSCWYSNLINHPQSSHLITINGYSINHQKRLVYGIATAPFFQHIQLAIETSHLLQQARGQAVHGPAQVLQLGGIRS